ncbi:unnamed protein product [Cuscuta epithymum]|uniref:DNA polymerase delta subunit 3 n=1 Tax=Cuscuta epithymum TaxID=186058 RepID=A0AAV0FIW3_9ASTE|nr:unnamed protein product [Cuscuta epithymum]
MAEIETLGILDEIQSLVSIKLQVVSYKWLSQNYLVSSDAAKRLLEEFVEKHINDVEVVYSLSGWLKNNPSAYHVQLVSSSKIAEAKQEFNENCSVQVYSVQACIPKDAATLWNAEFVQAEELFKQSPSVDNCLWDNRFCGVLNPFIKQNADRKSASTGDPQAKNSGAIMASNCKLTSQSVTFQPPQSKKVQHAEPSADMAMANYVKNEVAVEGGSNIDIDKEKVAQPLENKKNIRTDKTSALNGGVLADMWGRATTKLKTGCIPTETNKAIPISAETQVCTSKEFEDANCFDDRQDVTIKRSNSRGNRKRRVIYDSSDEEGEDAVNLSSPDPPGLKSSSNTPEVEKMLCFKGDEKMNKQFKGESSAKESKSLSNDANVTGISDHGHSNDANVRAKLTDVAPKSPQRKKVLKTKIDERGREVTEVIWEGEETKPDGSLAMKTENKVANNAVDRPTAAKRSHVTESIAPLNQAVKAGNKKGGNKDRKQGNILSFFKRAS